MTSLRRVAWRVILPAGVALAAIVWWLSARPSRGERPRMPPATIRATSGPLTLAAVGDLVLAKPWPAGGADAAFDEVTGLLQRASLAVGNLEETLRATSSAPTSANATLWPSGSDDTAASLRRAGFTVVTRANNHASDGGAESLAATAEVLSGAGLGDAGAGADLDRARAPLVLGTAPRRVAVVAVTTSAADEARATRARGEIAGRPGVSVLRYVADVTADPVTYAALADMARATHQGSETAAGLELSGRLIKKGVRTSVELKADERDAQDIFDVITAARAAADVVVVALHSHEPGNVSTAPAPFVRSFAQQAIAHGASLVIGHGPRQLRGVEAYQGGVILYSLGNFAFDGAAIPPGAADVYDANTDLNGVALEATGQTGPPRLPAYIEPVWWESVVATVGFENGKVSSVALTPIDLGVDLKPAERGRPRPASAERGSEILRRLADLSRDLGTTIRIEGNAGIVDLR